MDERNDEKRGDPQINLGQIVGKDHKYELSVSNETPEDATARRAREMAEAELRRKMSYLLFCFALFIVGVFTFSRLERWKIKNGPPALSAQLHPV